MVAIAKLYNAYTDCFNRIYFDFYHSLDYSTMSINIRHRAHYTLIQKNLDSDRATFCCHHCRESWHKGLNFSKGMYTWLTCKANYKYNLPLYVHRASILHTWQHLLVESLHKLKFCMLVTILIQSLSLELMAISHNKTGIIYYKPYPINTGNLNHKLN